MKAIITGGSSGIGRDMAYYLSNKGYDLILVGKNKDKLNEVKKKIKTDVKIYDIDLSIIENVYKFYEIVKNEDIIAKKYGITNQKDLYEAVGIVKAWHGIDKSKRNQNYWIKELGLKDGVVAVPPFSPVDL